MEPLGTGGAIRNAAAGLTSAPDEPVLIFNGDILSGHDLSGQIKTHESTGAAVTLHLVHVADPRAFGCVPTTPDGRVTAFLEKLPEPITDQINGGCYVFTRSVIDQIPAGRTVSVERETFPGLLAAQVRIQGFLDDAYWLDLGSPAAYVTGSADLVTGVMWTSAVPAPGPAPFLALAGALLHPQAHACDGSVLGVGTSVAVGAHVERSVLGDRVSVGAGARLLRCAVGADVVIGEGSQLIDCAIGDGVQVPAGAHWEQVRAPESA